MTENPIKLVDIEAEKRAETPAAVLLYDGKTTAWIPKQHIEDNGDGSWTLPRWVARDKGLI